MLSPLPRRSDWVPASLTSPALSAFPGLGAGSACASSFSRLARRSLALRPAHSRCHQFVTRFTRGFNHFVTSIVCSGCFRLERLPGGTFTHWESAAFARRTLKADIQVFRGNVFGSHTALRKGDWKIVREQPDQTWQLFDLARDLSESNDLASVHPQRVVELEAPWAAGETLSRNRHGRN